MFKRTILLVTAVFALAAGSALADGNGNAGQVKGPFAGTVHAVGTITYTDGSQQVWNWDRGKITALDSSSITLTRRDKAQVTFAITSSTVVRNDGGSYQLSDLKVGLAATVVSQDGNATIIRNIRGDGAPGGADSSAIDGPAAKSVTGTIDALYVDGSTQSFTYDRGRITQVGNGSLTIKRADAQSVTYTYDDSTLVREGKGQVESVSDLTVGEGAMFFSQNGALQLVLCLGQPKLHQQAGPGASAPAPAAVTASVTAAA
jgi:Domain of unknown function (DUF5666)